MTTIHGSPPAPRNSLRSRSEPPVVTEEEATVTTAEGGARYVWGALRLMMGWIFLWPFLDKLFGLHHETASAYASPPWPAPCCWS